MGRDGDAAAKRERGTGAIWRRFPGASLQMRLLGVSALLAVCVGLCFGVLISALLDAAEAQRANERTSRALAVANGAQKWLVDVETGSRGFLLTRSERFLEPWHAGRRELPAELRSLERLLAEGGTDARLARQIDAEADSYIHDYSEPLVALARRDREAAVRKVATGEGKRRLDAIRARFGRLIASQNSLAMARSRRVERIEARAIRLSLVGLALSTLFIALSAIYLSRSVIVPLGRFARAAGRLGAGELTARVPEDGPREVVRLGESFNSMAASLQSSRGKLRTRNDELVEAKAEAERANQAKSEYLSRMSHELRTPLNSILGFGQLLEMDDLEPRNRGHVEHILKGGRHLLDLIDEVLDIARIEAAGAMAVSRHSMRPRETLEAAVAMMRPLAAEREIAMVIDFGTAADLDVSADEQRLKQVVLNLLSNAIKYNRDGGRVEVACERVDERLRLRVSDTGTGLDASGLDRLFTPFDRLGAEQSGVQGTGLGLALSKRLVELMGGTLRVESELGVGTSFSVELDIAATTAARDVSAEDRGSPSPWAKERLSGARILYIEDNLANLRLVEELLGLQPGIELQPAMQGGLGLDFARRHRPDLVLLDLHLPDIRGDEVLRRLISDPATRDIPVIIVSADATPREVERLLEAGASAYLTKPFDLTRFLAVVEDLLPQRELART